MEEYYLNTSMNKVLPSKGGTKSDDCAEESGWTVYFEDYFLSNNRETTTCSSVSVSSSLVSDAASCAAWKKYSSDQNGGVVGYSSEVGSEKRNKKLSFKKRRTRGALNDDDLEDTASSPVNRPKVSNMKQLGSNRRKKDYSLERFQEKATTSGHCSELQADDEGNELSSIGGENDYAELKKRGLCLVPLSMLLNYVG